ncbi:MAG: hypothetical protein IK081_12535 [Lachnospiraceae bacterium]|nr:hypothetical protein [Lachnospiraceae bacterium]
MIKICVDVCMTVILLALMAYQVTGEAVHEWGGIIMTILVITHQILNRRWYAVLFKGKYNLYRIITTCINLLLLAAIAVTAFCGMSMSGYAVPFLYGMAPVAFVRRFHLSMSHWAFVLMGMHLGLHVPAMTARFKIGTKIKTIVGIIPMVIGACGLYLFLENRMPDYLFFKVPFAFLDYEKASVLVFAESLVMLFFWILTGTMIAVICSVIRRKNMKDKHDKD